MKKVLNKILLLTTLIFTFILTKYDVYAASANIMLTSDKTALDINDTLTITITVSSEDTKLGAWIFDVSHDNKLQLVSGEERVVAVAEEENITSKEYTFTYKAISSGNSIVSISNPRVLEWDSEDEIDTNVSNNISITINQTQEPSVTPTNPRKW